MGTSAGIRDTTTPADYADSLTYAKAMDRTVRAIANDGFWLDEYTGTDQQKLDAAIADQKAATDRNMPAIVLPCRPMTFTTPLALYSGCKIVGAPQYSGQKNPDIASGSRSGPEVTLGGSISSGASSWWRSPGADTLDVLMANFQVQGSQGASTHQFLDYAGGGSMYPASFHSLSFNFMRGVFGRADRKCLVTQMSISGDWTMNNAWDTQMHLGGSDCLIAPSMMNIGVSSSPVQIGDVNRWFLRFDSLEADIQGKIYVSTMHGWRGMLLSGTGNGVTFNGGVYEGYKPTRVGGSGDLINSPGPGVQIKITGGTANFYGTKIGQGMDNPDASEDGLVQIDAGEVGMYGVQFYGRNMGSVNAIDHNGGRLVATGICKRQNEGAYWTGRPRISTTATVGSGTYSYYNPDQSLTTV